MRARPVVVIPVRDGADLLSGALGGFVPAAAELGGRVVVVDDASSDATSDVAVRGGAELIRLDEPSGPYAARNAGWRWGADHESDVAVFVDVRCRPRPGWLPNLVGALERHGSSLAAGEVVVAPSAHIAGRAAARLEPLALRHGREAAFLPYAPTCHLAVRVPALREVDGFRAVRGGGDVDLCWRLQLAGKGPIAWADDAVLEWKPRERVRDLLSQHHRYGRNSARLCTEYSDAGCTPPPPVPLLRSAVHHARVALSTARKERVGAWPGVAVASVAQWTQEAGYARERRSLARHAGGR